MYIFMLYWEHLSTELKVQLCYPFTGLLQWRWNFPASLPYHAGASWDSSSLPRAGPGPVFSMWTSSAIRTHGSHLWRYHSWNLSYHRIMNIPESPQFAVTKTNHKSLKIRLGISRFNGRLIRSVWCCWLWSGGCCCLFAC